MKHLSTLLLPLFSCTLLCDYFADAFCSQRTQHEEASLYFHKHTALAVNFGWFSGGDGEQAAIDEKIKANASRGLGGVASMMTNIENLQASQKYGKLTAGVVNELSSMAVEGVSPDGKVKVTMSGQQRPVGISIDEAFFEVSDVSDVKQSVMAAMEEAYERSVERMDEKMKSFYKEIGIL
ncbi:hypothetical protein MPSEU_000476100 [Mayamaea pseudoterrestris]|nr:hypothetical protein MPSEU_000476100 [Mayamaea pseudoterrestris]